MLFLCCFLLFQNIFEKGKPTGNPVSLCGLFYRGNFSKLRQRGSGFMKFIANLLWFYLRPSISRIVLVHIVKSGTPCIRLYKVNIEFHLVFTTTRVRYLRIDL